MLIILLGRMQARRMQALSRLLRLYARFDRKAARGWEVDDRRSGGWWKRKAKAELLIFFLELTDPLLQILG